MNYNLTRIAPTPSGFLHLGNAYSFLLTKALAQKHGAKILLRIDDLDRERYRPEYVEDIFETLDFLEIPIDQGPKSIQEFESEWSQIHRMSKYEHALEKIRESGLVFACDCSRKKIQEINPQGSYLGYCLDRRMKLDKPETAWRINTLESDFVNFVEFPYQANHALVPEETGFYLIRKKDRLPAYHLTSVVDDEYFGVDLIIRGKDLFPSTLAQLDLARILSFEKFPKATFLHHPLIKGPKREKLSKTAGATSIQSMRKEGKKLEDLIEVLGRSINLPEPIRNFEEFQSALV